MADSLRARWLEIAARLAVEPEARCLCPRCGQYVVEVRDVRVDEVFLERVLTCPECGQGEAVLLRRKVGE